MSNKNKQGGLVYSTNPDVDTSAEEEYTETPEPGDQQLRVLLDARHRKGKIMTVVTDFVGSEDDLKDLGKTLKNKCGTGGSVKDGEILIQGKFKEKVAQELRKMGYKVKVQ
ncbi:MAG: translation initiation factor, partial [Chitinophagales bacterium]